MADMTAFFAAEYNEEHWNNFASINHSDTQIDGIPQDVVDAVLGVLGDNVGYDWLTCTPLRQFGGKTAIELLKSSEGERALKAFIMRFPC